MSLDHAKKSLTEKLKSDEDFRARVANYILYHGFSDDLKNIKKENLTQRHDENGYFSSLSTHNGDKSYNSDSLQGYEFWAG